MHNFCNCFYI